MNHRDGSRITAPIRGEKACRVTPRYFVASHCRSSSEDVVGHLYRRVIRAPSLHDAAPLVRYITTPSCASIQPERMNGVARPPSHAILAPIVDGVFIDARTVVLQVLRVDLLDADGRVLESADV